MWTVQARFLTVAASCRYKASAGQGVAHSGAKDLRECVARHEEARMSGLDPGCTIGGEPARGDEEVCVRMVLERA